MTPNSQNNKMTCCEKCIVTIADKDGVPVFPHETGCENLSCECHKKECNCVQEDKRACDPECDCQCHQPPEIPGGLDELVRDICTVEHNIKSEVRDRIEKLLSQDRERIREAVEKIKKLDTDGDKDASVLDQDWIKGRQTGYNDALDDVLELLNTER